MQTDRQVESKNALINPIEADATAPPLSPSITATAPGQIKVIKRNGTVVSYDNSKISVAITKAFLAVEGGNAAASSRIHQSVEQMTQQIQAIFDRRMPSGGTIHIEDIQDQVELALMRSGEQKVARSYVLYREEHARLRAEQQASQPTDAPSINVTYPDGNRQPLDYQRLQTLVSEACQGLVDVNAEVILEEALKNLYDGVDAKEVNSSLVMTARTMVEKDPNYSYVTARLLLDTMRS
ncbi:MAG: ATP cone domain-containing protein, partial [Pseudomonadales bacterium]|nr:ATP cone domain-containing protein [Pseudomonadales bacterium]